MATNLLPPYPCAGSRRLSGRHLTLVAFLLACGGSSSHGGETDNEGGASGVLPSAGEVAGRGGGGAAEGDAVQEPGGGSGGGEESTPSTETPLEPLSPGEVPSAADAFRNVVVTELERVHTVQEIAWSQAYASDSTHVAFTFENDEWLESPRRPTGVGDHREVVLGAPEGVELSIKLVARFGDEWVESPLVTVTNGSAPNRMPRPDIETFSPELASSHRWLLGSVSEGGTGSYGATHWMYLIDRRGRVVWYQPAAGGDGSLDSGYAPRVSLDGTHVTYDEQTRGNDGYVKFATLDFRYEREIRIPDIGDAHAIASDGAVLYEDGNRIWEVAPDDPQAEDRREIFNCDLEAVPQDRGALPVGAPQARCYANALNYDPNSDSMVISYPYADTALQLSREGQVLRTFGELGNYAIDPEYEFDFNHWVHVTSAGTLMVSSHRAETEVHLFNEYEIDDSAMELRLLWTYGDDAGDDYAAERGMAALVEDSTNRLANYGPTGVIVEVTEDGEVAWRVKFSDNELASRSIDATPLPEGTRGNLIHNNVLLNDLYALNRGPAPASP